MELLAARNLTDLLQATAGQWVLLLIFIGLLIGLIMWVRSILSESEDTTNVDHEMLTSMTELQRRGELSSEEYRSIKGRLASRLQPGPSTREQMKPDSGKDSKSVS